MDKILLFCLVNYMAGNGYLIGFVSGVFFGVNYHETLRPYTETVENEVKKKIDEYKKAYEDVKDKNKDVKDKNK